MSSRIETTSRAKREGITAAPPTAAEAAARPNRSTPMRAASLFALALIPLAGLINVFFSKPGEAASDDEAGAPASDRENAGAGVPGEGPGPDISDGAMIAHHVTPREPAPQDEPLPSPYAQPLLAALGPGQRLALPDRTDPLMADFAAARLDLPETATGSLPNLGSVRPESAPRPAASTGPAPEAAGAPDEVATAVSDPGPTQPEPFFNDAIATLFEEIGHWFGDAPADTVSRVTDLTVGDLMQEVSFEELMRQATRVDDYAGAPFVVQVHVLHDPAAREAFADRMGFGAPDTDTVAALQPDPDTTPALDIPTTDLT